RTNCGRNCTSTAKFRSRRGMHAVAFLKAPEKQSTGPAVVLYGGERFLKQEALRVLSRLVLGEGGVELALVRLPGASTDLETVVGCVATVCEGRPPAVVVVEDGRGILLKFPGRIRKFLQGPGKEMVSGADCKSWPSNTRLAKKVAAIGLPLECGALKG